MEHFFFCTYSPGLVFIHSLKLSSDVPSSGSYLLPNSPFLCARGYSLACSTSKQFTDHFYHISQTCLCQFLTFFCCGHLWQFGNAFEVIHSCSELCFKNILKIIMETDNTGMQSVPYTSLVPRTTYLVCLHVRHSIFRSPESSADVAHLYFFFY